MLWDFTWDRPAGPIKEAYSGFLLGLAMPQALGAAPSCGWGAVLAQEANEAIVCTVFFFIAFITIKKPISLKKDLKDARRSLSLSLVTGYRA